MEKLGYIPNKFAQQYITAISGVIVPMDFMALCDDNPFDAILLAQIVYWYRPDKKGNRKLQVYNEGHWWIAKKHSAWYSECRINERTIRRCLKRLQDSGLIVYKVSGFSGMTIPHMRINWEVFEAKIKAVQKEAIDPKGQEQLTPKVNPNTETNTEITTETLLKDSSSDESSDPVSPIGETTMPESKSIESSVLRAKESPEPYAYGFDNNPLSRTDYDALLTNIDTMKDAVLWAYDHPKVIHKLSHMMAWQIAHQFLGSKKNKSGKTITGERKKFNFSDKPATPQEVIAFGIWFKQNNNWIPSQKAEELHEQFTEYRNLPHHEHLLRLAQSELTSLLRIRIGKPFPRHEPVSPVAELDSLLADMTTAVAEQQKKTHGDWYEKHAEDIEWHKANARKLSATPSQRRGWLNL